MEKDLFELYERQGGLAIEVGHNSIADWIVTIYDRKGVSLAEARQVVQAQDCLRETAFARAYVELTEYLSNERGGY